MMLNCCNLKCFKTKYQLIKSIIQTLIYKLKFFNRRDIKVQARANIQVDKHALAIMRSNSLSKKLVVGHIPQNISKFSSMFLKIPFTSIQVEVVGKKLNRGGGYELEIPVTIKKRLSKDQKRLKKSQNVKFLSL